jgi:outer membrane protein assembly factor BamB
VTGAASEPDDDPEDYFDYLTIAYDARTGVSLWQRRYDEPGPGDDLPAAIAVSPDGGTVYVTGESQRQPSRSDYATIAYDAETGAQRWLARYNGPANFNDEATALGVSPDGTRLFVTGASSSGGYYSYDYATIAYDAATGSPVWEMRYDGGGFSSPHALGVAPSGRYVYVTGALEHPGGCCGDFDFGTIAYSGETGEQLWVARYRKAPMTYNAAHSLSLSPDGKTIYVAGYSSHRIATVAYSPLGKRRWVIRYPDLEAEVDSGVVARSSPTGLGVFVAADSVYPLGDPVTIAYPRR